MSESKHVYTAILEVAAAMSREGLGKDRVADTGGSGKYRFRGVDDVMNALSPHLVRAKLVIVPRVIDRTVSERTTKSGTVMTYACLTIEFDFVSAVDGTCHTARTMGEAMDSGDKATNKAMSAGYKYVCFQTFCIPTEGDNDSENQTHTREPGEKSRDLTAPLAASVGDWDKWAGAQMSALRVAAAKGQGELREAWAALYTEVRRVKPPALVQEQLSDCHRELKGDSGRAAHA